MRDDWNPMPPPPPPSRPRRTALRWWCVIVIAAVTAIGTGQVIGAWVHDRVGLGDLDNEQPRP